MLGITNICFNSDFDHVRPLFLVTLQAISNYNLVQINPLNYNQNQTKEIQFKGILHFFLEIGSFYHSPRVKQLSFTVFKSIQPIF